MRKYGLVLCAFLVGTALADEAQLVPVRQVVEEARDQIEEIGLEELAALEEQGAILIDIREPDETRGGVIPDAELIPRGMLEFRVKGVTEDPNQPIVVYCRSGNRGALAAVTLQELGYRHVYSLQGGYKAWEQAREMEALSPKAPGNR